MRNSYAIHRTGPLKAFRNEADAVRAGAWVAATFLGNAKALAYCEKSGIEVRQLSQNSTGGVFVPIELQRAIIELRERRGAFRRAAQVLPMAGDTASVPTRQGGITPYYTAEGVAPTPSDVLVGNINLVARKLSAVTNMSNELDEDAAADLGDLLAREMAYAFADAEDKAGFNGDGTSTYAKQIGVITKLSAGTMAGAIVAASGHDTWPELDAVDLANLVGALPDYAIPGAAWFCSAKAFAFVFCRLAGASGGILMAPDATGRLVPTFMGWPVITSSILPGGTNATDFSNLPMILFGDLALAATLGDRRGITLTKSDKAPSVFAADVTAFKATERFHVNVHDVGDATNPGPIVALIGN